MTVTEVLNTAVKWGFGDYREADKKTQLEQAKEFAKFFAENGTQTPQEQARYARVQKSPAIVKIENEDKALNGAPQILKQLRYYISKRVNFNKKITYSKKVQEFIDSELTSEQLAKMEAIYDDGRMSNVEALSKMAEIYNS